MQKYIYLFICAFVECRIELFCFDSAFFLPFLLLLLFRFTQFDFSAVARAHRSFCSRLIYVADDNKKKLFKMSDRSAVKMVPVAHARIKTLRIAETKRRRSAREWRHCYRASIAHNFFLLFVSCFRFDDDMSAAGTYT